MKRSGIAIVATLALVFLATGCVGKESKLVCTQTKSGVDVEFNVGFKGNLIKSMDFNYDMDLSKYSDTQISAIEKRDFCTYVKNAMYAYKDAFTDCDQKIENKHLIVDSELSVDKLAKNLTDKMTTPQKAKTELEKQGYKCSIK